MLARQLAKVKGANVTVIDSRQRMLHNIAGVRAAVRPGWEGVTQVPRDAVGGTFIHAWVTNITDTEVFATRVGGDEEVSFPYDILVLATGSHVRFPGKLTRALGDMEEYALAAYRRVQAAIRAAKDITIAGGGPVGLELAGEIVNTYTDKHVRIINSADTLLSGAGLTKKTTKLAEERAVAEGIEVVLGERVTAPPGLFVEDDAAAQGGAGGEEKKDDARQPGDDYLQNPGTITTESGREFKTDLLLWCTGGRTNSAAYASWLGDTVNPDNGRVRVNEYLQVQGKPNVFAIGDCADTPEMKLAAIAMRNHVPFAATAIVNFANGKPLGKAYKPVGSMICTCLCIPIALRLYCHKFTLCLLLLSQLQRLAPRTAWFRCRADRRCRCSSSRRQKAPT